MWQQFGALARQRFLRGRSPSLGKEHKNNKLRNEGHKELPLGWTSGWWWLLAGG